MASAAPRWMKPPGAQASLPVVDDHFGSKEDLHRRPLKRHYAELGTAQANLDAAVHTARQRGLSWAKVGAAAGMTAQAAHERWA
jgi:hypothetical protein